MDRRRGSSLSVSFKTVNMSKHDVIIIVIIIVDLSIIKSSQHHRLSVLPGIIKQILFVVNNYYCNL